MNGLRDGLEAGWATIYYTSNWATDKSPASDWAIIVLDRNIGSYTGWCGIQSYGDDSYLNGKTGYSYGYPGGQSLGYCEYQWMTSGTIASASSTQFDISTLYVGGISGGPVYLNEGGDMIVGMCKAVYTSPGDDWSLCTRITSDMVDLVNSLY